MQKTILQLLICTTLVFSSCSSTFFYTTVNSPNEYMEKVENGDFLYENDSLWIAYCFKGEDAPIQITVFNKLDIPLYLDWNRSSLILGGIAHPYNRSSVTYIGDGYDNDYSVVVENKLSNTSFIPPNTMVSHSTLYLSARFDRIANKEYTNTRMVTNQQMSESAKRINFEQENSPFAFSSYLTLYTDPLKPQAYKSDFFVKSLIKTKIKPQNLPLNLADRGDTFYQQKHPNYTGLEIIAGTALVVGAIAIDVVVSNNDCCD